MKFYYRIWVDCIVKLMSKENNKENWKLKSMLTMSIAMTFNLVLFMSILQKHIIHYYFYELYIPFFSSYQNNIITILILFVLPCVLINYLLIFRVKKYEKLLNQYSYSNGKLFLGYFLTSMFIPIILMWISIFLFKK